MLERLAGNADATPLFVLDQVLEPLNCDLRRQVRHYTFLTPLNRLVDATPPESDEARQFGTLATTWQVHSADLRSRLALWRDNQMRVVPLLRSSALLQEDVQLADEVSAVASAGLEALDYLESKRQPTPDWIERRRALLEDAAKPRAELLIAIVPDVKQLVDAAAAVQ
jgi:hexosaminidase